jgi:hypothetical protein
MKQLYETLYEKYKREKDPIQVDDEFVAFCIALTGQMTYDKDEARVIVVDTLKRNGIKAIIDAARRFGLHPIKKQ